eukprot:TRINITY_DN6204_c1_g1_i1.p1 TRINITY_DN6204_c1_g1~~TRINITY_DN6204_c1_g1_i1.p1  ORF type:complete len:316 (-),score=59.73 TRINITY_DN6204_c1_g1_i1:69-1016(-)
MIKMYSRLETQHEDLIHDLSYDFYGKRLATCSSDQKIKVWDQAIDKRQVEEEEGNEWKLTFEWKAHSGSIWKVAWAHPEFGNVIASCSFDRTVCIWEEEEDNKGEKSWKPRATLVDSRESVTDIKFAPRHHGFKLAACSNDGYVRTYEAIDVTNLSHWSLMEEFESQKGPINCIAWNPSPSDTRPLLAVGGNDGLVKIWEYNDMARRWVLLETLEGHKDAIHDISWAPTVGRSYHLIATASKDKKVKIWKFVNQQKPEVVASFEEHKSEVWRVEWNILGTILASSGDDGKVRLYRMNFLNEWKCLSEISGEDNDE